MEYKFSIDEFIINSDSSILDALKSLNRNEPKICIVVDDKVKSFVL